MPFSVILILKILVWLVYLRHYFCYKHCKALRWLELPPCRGRSQKSAQKGFGGTSGECSYAAGCCLLLIMGVLGGIWLNLTSGWKSGFAWSALTHWVGRVVREEPLYIYSIFMACSSHPFKGFRNKFLEKFYFLALSYTGRVLEVCAFPSRFSWPWKFRDACPPWAVGVKRTLWRSELGLYFALDIRGDETLLVTKRDWNCERGNSATVCRGPLRLSKPVWWVSLALLYVTA